MPEPTYVLSVYCGHDACVAMLRDGALAVAISQERIDRIKHSDATGREAFAGDEQGFPHGALQYCLDAAGIAADQVAYCTTNFDGDAPPLGRERLPFPGHHLSHASSVFFPSGSDRCAVLVMDYAGDTIRVDTAFAGYERESVWLGDADGLALVSRHLGNAEGTLFGMGCVYNQIAAYLFGGGDPEGKLMALAAYGRPNRELGESFFALQDGSVFVRPSPLFKESGDRPAFLPADVPHYECELDWDALPPSPVQQGRLTQFHKDLAFHVQRDLEEAVLYMGRHVRRVTGARDVGLAGGVALNCAANARFAEQAGYDRVFVPPAAGDSGQALGAALWVERARRGCATVDLGGGYGGRSYSVEEIETALRDATPAVEFVRCVDIADDVARRLVAGEIVGWFQGPSEFGPRALGGRSLIADPRRRDVITRLNRVVKRREDFQPVAPSVLVEECSRFFEIDDSPYMCFAAIARPITRKAAEPIVHADGTSRVHAVRREYNPLFHALISRFHSLTGLPLIANTSLNDKGEPIVERPAEAIQALLRMPMDALAIGPFLARRTRK